MPGRKGLGAEHPLSDRVQIVFVIVYLAVWGLDSFVFRFSTVLSGVFPVFIRLILAALGIVLFIVGVYVVRESENLIFDRADGKPKLVTTGIYRRVRHPLYLVLC